jgi:acyl-CoA thioesterase
MEIWLKNQIGKIFKDNPLSFMMGIYISALSKGEATLTMPIDKEIHTNIYGIVHGGVLFTLADSVMGIACLTAGNLVVTSNISMMFITNSRMGNRLSAYGKIIHKGNDIIVADAEIKDRSQRLLAKAQGSYFIHRPIKPEMSEQQND